jgi:hypothetical protein
MNRTQPLLVYDENVHLLSEVINTRHKNNSIQLPSLYPSAFFLGGCRSTCTPKHFVKLTRESKNFKMLLSYCELCNMR